MQARGRIPKQLWVGGRKGVFGGLKTTKTKGLGGPHRPPGPTPPYSTCARRLPLLLLHPNNLSSVPSSASQAFRTWLCCKISEDGENS